ncbi:hypothetical protein HOY80DRAFT_1025005 [Tuber brumale]|nr:hypothetical protein HOY80DRAFT_1025005 [Tuber brumale]
MAEMGRKSLGATRKAKIPKHITKIAMTSEKYYDLKVYIKSIIIPGTPAFECNRLGNNSSKQAYRLWLHNLIEEIGPRFFPTGGRGLAWPEDYDQICKAVHQVVRALSIGIRKSYKMRGLGAVKETGREKMEMAQGGELHGGAAADNTDAEEEVMMLNGHEVYVERVQEEERMMMAMDQGNQDNNTMDEDMNAEPIEMEDLLDAMMKPEVFANFPNLDDEYFDWYEVVDPMCPDPAALLIFMEYEHIGVWDWSGFNK